MCCPYCEKRAVLTIVSFPEQVCLEHALEFWTGLLLCAKDPPDPCVKHERLCHCRSCEAVHATSRRAMAIAIAGQPPGDHESFPIRLAS